MDNTIAAPQGIWAVVSQNGVIWAYRNTAERAADYIKAEQPNHTNAQLRVVKYIITEG